MLATAQKAMIEHKVDKHEIELSRMSFARAVHFRVLTLLGVVIGTELAGMIADTISSNIITHLSLYGVHSHWVVDIHIVVTELDDASIGIIINACRLNSNLQLLDLHSLSRSVFSQ
jgi:hypothetical protein